MNVALRPDSLNIISLCTGGGGLDLGVELAMPGARSVVLVEREAFAAGHLVAAMQQGLLGQAPIWSDVTTFDGRAWRGLVDGLIGGIPCQPHSLAGKRLGEEDERDLWSDARRIFVQSGAWFILIENVRGMLSSGGAERVWRDLQRLGCSVEVGLFTAAEVGAPHERERVFILAVLDHAESRRERRVPGDLSSPPYADGPSGPAWRDRDTDPSGQVLRAVELADAGRERDERWGRPGDILRSPGTGEGQGHQWERHGAAADHRSDCLAYAEDAGLAVGQQSEIERGHLRHQGPAVAPGGDGMGNAIGSRHDGRPDDTFGRSIGRTAAEGSGGEPDGSMAHPDLVELRRQPSTRQQPILQRNDALGLFPPGPSDLSRWRHTLERAPELEPAFRRVADGLASRLDTARVDRLRLLGNGVVSLEAAYAIRTLATRLAASGSAGAERLVRMMEFESEQPALLVSSQQEKSQ